MLAPPVTLLATTMSLSLTVKVCTLNMVSVPKTLRLPEIVALLLIRRLPPVMLPVADTCPAVVRLPPATLPVTESDPRVPRLVILVCAAVVSVPDMLVNAPFVAPMLPTLALPVALSVPVILAPVAVTVITLAVPAADIVTLPLRNVRTLAVPFCMAVASIPVSWLPLPIK